MTDNKVWAFSCDLCPEMLFADSCVGGSPEQAWDRLVGWHDDWFDCGDGSASRSIPGYPRAKNRAAKVRWIKRTYGLKCRPARVVFLDPA